MAEQATTNRRSMAIVVLIAGLAGVWHLRTPVATDPVDPLPPPVLIDLEGVPQFAQPLALQLAMHRDHAKAYGNLWASMAKAVETSAATPQDLDQFSQWHNACGKTAGPKIALPSINVGPLFDATVRGVLGIDPEPASGVRSVYMADKADDVLKQLVKVAEVAHNGK